MRKRWIAPLALALGMGCSGEATTETAAPAEPAGPSWVDQLPAGDPASGLPAGEMRTIELTAERITAGGEIYGSNCAPCHGPAGEGRLGIGPQLTSDTFLAAASDDYLVRTIARGREGTTMPGWGRSHDRPQIEAIVAYLRSLNEVAAVELDDSPAEGDAEAGGQRFAEICAACHGTSGAGYQETSNGTGIGRAAFLSDVSNGYLRHIVREGKSDTPMRPFGRPSATAVANLTDEEVENVITYLRANAW